MSPEEWIEKDRWELLLDTDKELRLERNKLQKLRWACEESERYVERLERSIAHPEYIPIFPQFSKAIAHAAPPAQSTRFDARIAARSAAKARKDYESADFIRAELLAEGVKLADHADGTTTWSRT